MKKTGITIFICIVISILFLNCGSSSNTGEEDQTIAVREGKSVSDTAHDGDGGHFYILPPMVKSPDYYGVFDHTLDPVVEIIDMADGTILETFTTGTGSESIRVDVEDEHYIVNWHTKSYHLNPEIFYRIKFFVDDIELGFADVDVVASGKDLKTVDTGDYIALKNGRTLPIKFRIEEGALDSLLPYIEPDAGSPGTVFKIHDSQGRIEPDDIVLFYSPGTDPSTGFIAEDTLISSDGKVIEGIVPANLEEGLVSVSVREAVDVASRFEDLVFEVWAP